MKKKSTSQSAFFKLRLLIAVLLCFGAITLVLFAQPRTPSGQSGSSQPIVSAQYRGVVPVVKFDISPPLRSIKPFFQRSARKRKTRRRGRFRLARLVQLCAILPCSECSARLAYRPRSFHSMEISNLCGCAPPDPNGAVGPNHVVTMSNLHFQIFSKTGTSLFGPAANNTLWSGFGGGCQTQNAGDPVVLYDQLADRWLLSQFTSAAPYFNA